ncbi:MAG: itaconate degradation C-C-lyase RipC [Methylorubrum populi]
MTSDPSSAARPLRSLLFTPATKPERFGKAAAVGADALILDLEDAVASGDKDAARRTALDHLARTRDDIPLRALRINAIETRAGLADLAALLDGEAEPDLVVLPKVEDAGTLHIADRLLAAAGKRAGLIALIESARGLAALDGIAGATPRLAGLMFGAADMAADLGADTAWEPLLHARSRLVAAATLSGLTTIDTPFFDIRDGDGLARETKAAVTLGFAAKAAIHPGQIATINAHLTPSPAVVDVARRILAENAKGVGTVDGRMIDEAVARKARRTLAAAGEPLPTN